MAWNSLIRRMLPSRGLDLNKLISNIEKYLGKDLKFSMREFRQLQLLREDVLKLEQIMSHRVKNQAGLLEHYREHARGIERYSERIERRMNVWIKRLENLITAEEQNLTAKDRQYFESYFESWKNKIDICKNNLIRILARGGELHNLINEKSPNLKKVEAKINEAFGDNEHPGLRTLIALFQQLKQVEERVGKSTVRGIIKERRLEQLGEWGFPVQTEPKLADFLVEHWNGTVEMARAAGGNAEYLFLYGLPVVKDLINERTWPDILRMVKYVGIHLGFVPKSLLEIMPNSKSIYDFDERLKKQTSFAEQLFKEVGFTEYTRKIIDENFWNFQNDNRVFNRLKFEKTGSSLVPLGGRFKTKYLVRIIRQESFEAWKKAQEANIPVEEIVRHYPAKDGMVRVYCKYAGEQLGRFVSEHPEFSEEVKRQRDEIIKGIGNLGIMHATFIMEILLWRKRMESWL